MQIQKIDCNEGINNTRYWPNYQNFRGDVGRLKAIIMQPDAFVSTYYRTHGHIDVKDYVMQLFKQLKAVGKKEGFVVGFQDNNKRIHLISDNLQQIKNDAIKMSCWAQDNGIYTLDRMGKPMILENALIRESEAGLLKARAKTLGVRFKQMFSRADGGNTYFGVTENGERYILIGSNAIDDTALKIALHQQSIELKNLQEASNGTVRIDFKDKHYYTRINDIVNGTMAKELPDELKQNSEIAVKNLRKNIDTLRLEAKKALANDFEMEIDQVRVVSSPGFHIDMFMRPIDEKTIVVNNPDLTRTILKKEALASETPEKANEINKILNDISAFENQRVKENGYAPMDKIISELRDLGYEEIIEVPGIFGNGNTNYLNALVHQRPNGDYVYITNTGSRSQDVLNLNEIFQNTLQEKFPRLKEFYFLGDIKGTPISDVVGNPNKERFFINELLSLEDGGTHCCSFEMLTPQKVTR